MQDELQLRGVALQLRSRVWPLDSTTIRRELSPDTIDEIGSSGVFELYDRAIEFASFAEFADKLDAAVQAYPALEPRLSAPIAAVGQRSAESGPAWLYYTGCSVQTSAESRAQNDFDVSETLFTNLVKVCAVREVHVFKVNLAEVAVDAFEFRDRLDLQREEHALVSLRFPHNLNSSPGGLPP